MNTQNPHVIHHPQTSILPVPPNWVDTIQYLVLRPGFDVEERIALRVVTRLSRGYCEIINDHSAAKVDLLDDAVIDCEIGNYLELYGLSHGSVYNLNVCGACGGGVCCRDGCLHCYAWHASIHTWLSMTNNLPLPAKVSQYLEQGGHWKFEIMPQVAQTKEQRDWQHHSSIRAAFPTH